MARGPLMLRFARWHIWLGWLVAVPLLLWTLSGLFMALRPIEDVRGEALRRPPPPLLAAGLVAPRIAGTVLRVALIGQNGSLVWIVTRPDKTRQRYDARTGLQRGPVALAEARALAAEALAGTAAPTAVHSFAAAEAPLDLRQPRASWQLTYGDGAHLYIDAETGEVLALRTRWWRVYDLMWGLHIMDLQTREDTSHPLLIGFAALALAGSILGTALLFRRRKARR